MAGPAPGGRSNLRGAGQGDVGVRARRQYLSGIERAAYGFVCTFENAQGETLSAHRVGRTDATLPPLLDELAALGGDWRLASYSTPDTIRLDVMGERGEPPYHFPEVSLLARLQRRELLHPRLGGPPWR